MAGRNYQAAHEKNADAMTNSALDIAIRGHPVMDRPLTTMAEFRQSAQLLHEAGEFSKLAKHVGMQLDCGCHVPNEMDRDYIKYNIPRSYVPLPRPYKIKCDGPKCINRAVMQKFLNISVTVKNINVTEDLLPVMKSRIRNSLYKSCSKVNLCLAHFEDNFIKDCPHCAKNFGLCA